MNVVAKFKCNTKVTSDSEHMVSTTVNLNPVSFTPDKPDSLSFSKYTPSGSLSMLITNENALDFFKLGKEYYLTFEEAK